MLKLSGFGKIFGIGLSKTGTTSLNDALKILGYRSIHHANDKDTLEDLMTCNFHLRVMKQFDAATDVTVAPYYYELDHAFPGSKFILTVRDKEPWLASCERHWFAMPRYLREMQKVDDEKFHYFILAVVFGCHRWDRARFSRVYDVHCMNVKEYFEGRKDFLVMDICGGDGWGKLCNFLEVPLPRRKFPHVNKRPINK